MTSRILVFVPMYNCAPQIVRVLKAFEDPSLAKRFEGIICVNNRSTDNTEDAAVDALSRAVVPSRGVLRNADNYGLGGSHKVAIRYALEKGYTHIVVLHGDDQGSIGDLVPLIDAHEHLEFDCLLGARFMPGSQLVGYSALRTAANHAFNHVFSFTARERLYDLGSGLNMYRTEIFRNGFHLRFADDLTFNYYMILATSRLKISQKFFPLTWREDDQVSNAKLFRQGIKMLGILKGMVSNASAFLKAEHRAQPREAYDFEIVREWSTGAHKGSLPY